MYMEGEEGEDEKEEGMRQIFCKRLNYLQRQPRWEQKGKHHLVDQRISSKAED